MTKTLNILNLADASAVLPKDAFLNYEQYLSGREKPLHYREYELNALQSFLNLIDYDRAVPVSVFDGYTYSFTMRQLGKEFDLLKIGAETVISIELKTSAEPSDVKQQLLKNKHYLKALERAVVLFAYVEDQQVLYYLDGEELRLSSTEEILGVMQGCDRFETGDFDRFFLPSHFLISPINMPERFLNREYFLTQQQDEVKKAICKRTDGLQVAACITGRPGTGKSLLLYDIAFEFAERKPACVVHSAALKAQHASFNGMQNRIRIIGPKNAAGIRFSDYSAICIDEAHRMYPDRLDALIKGAKSNGLPCLIGLDSAQTLSKKEQSHNIQGKIEQDYPEFAFHSLSEKIRTNKEIASFISSMRDLNKANKTISMDCVHVLYAKSASDALRQCRRWVDMGFQYIHLSTSRYVSSELDCLRLPGSLSTHEVIGQEYDRVVMLIPGNMFFYDSDGLLKTREHPCPDYITGQLLFQRLTRTREELTLIFYGNKDLFEQVAKYVVHR